MGKRGPDRCFVYFSVFQQDNGDRANLSRTGSNLAQLAVPTCLRGDADKTDRINLNSPIL